MDSMAKFWLQDGHTYELVVAQACVVLPWLSSTCHGHSLGVPLWTHITHGTGCGFMLTFMCCEFAHPIDVSLDSCTPCAGGNLWACILSGIKIPCEGVNMVGDTQLPFPQHLIQIISFTFNPFIPHTVLKSL